MRPADDEAEAAWLTSPYVTYSEKYGLDSEAQTSAGLSLNTLFDSRDGPINPSRGVYASLVYRAFFEDFLGGASSWQHYDLARLVATRRTWLGQLVVVGGWARRLH